MKERPILMSAPMVRALLDGTKTQTRRLLKIQPLDTLKMLPGCPNTWVCLRQRNPSKGHLFTCRHGIPGDRLWVKETWGVHKDFPWAEGTKFMDIGRGWIGYRADESGCPPSLIKKWRPSIHMPRTLSRITLEITDVRCQRLQDITEEDAIAEGIERVTSIGPCRAMAWRDYSGGPGFFSPIDSYRSLWGSLNAKQPWTSNPWVWALTVKRI